MFLDERVRYTHDISDDGYDNEGKHGEYCGAVEFAEVDLLGLSGDPLFGVDNATYSVEVEGLALL